MGELRSIVDVIIEESKVTVSEEQERARARNEAGQLLLTYESAGMPMSSLSASEGVYS